jgi:hypothetical protein
MDVSKCQRGNDETNFLCDKQSIIVKLRKSVLAKYKSQGHESPKNKILTSQISVRILSSRVACTVFNITNAPVFKYCAYYPAFLEALVVVQLIKKFPPFMTPDVSVHCA